MLRRVRETGEEFLEDSTPFMSDFESSGEWFRRPHRMDPRERQVRRDLPSAV